MWSPGFLFHLVSVWSLDPSLDRVQNFKRCFWPLFGTLLPPPS